MMRDLKPDLQAIADAFGNAAVSAVMREALARPLPGGAGPSEAVRFFGKDLATIQGLIAPAVTAINQMLPGFRRWLARSGHGDDRYMITALLAIVAELERMPAPAPKRRIPRGIDRPVVLN